MPKRRTASRHKYHFLVGAVLGLLTSSSHASIVIDNWNLVTGVAYTNGGDAHISTVVQNPFVGVYAASGPGPTTALSTYNISWTTDNADFLIQGSHQAVGADPSLLQVGSEGGIYFTTTADLLLNVDAAYDYNLAGPHLFTELFTFLNTRDGGDWPAVFGTNRTADTFTSYPSAGAFSMNYEIPLLAGHQYLMGYSMRILAYNNTGAVGTGDGYIHFTLQEVPEPATFFTFIPVALMRRRRVEP